MSYNFAAESFRVGLTKLHSRLSFREIRVYTKNGQFAFMNPSLGPISYD